MSGSMYIAEFLGDLRDPMRAYSTLDAALDAIKAQFGARERNIDGDEYYATPDPEDDRIVVWEAVPGETCKVVWHFSGWHWDGEACDLPGGPLPQGKLPGFHMSLYDLAMTDL